MNLLHYDLLAEFKRQFYKDLLTEEHLISAKIHIPKLLCRDSITEEFDFWGYIFEKNNVKYLIASEFEGRDVDVRDILPIMPSDILEVANKGIVYKWARNPITVRFKPIKTWSFKQLIDNLTSMGHSNPTHYKLMLFQALTQMFNRANYRVSTPAGFGKDSTVDIIGNLLGSCATIENPTIAKLEDRANVLKWLAVNEVIDITPSQWRDIEQILLAMGAFKPEVTKRSKKHGGVGETINISQFSLSILYNDIDHYPDAKKYFDVIAKKAVRDRFPAFRLHGAFTEDFNEVNKINVENYVAEHIRDYKEIIYNFTYYKLNHMKHVHNYERIIPLIPLTKRWKTNIDKLLTLIDVYCDTQEEFNDWVKVINASITDYSDMLDYPTVRDEIIKKFGARAKEHLKDARMKYKTFTERNKYLNNILNPKEQTVRDIQFW